MKFRFTIFAIVATIIAAFTLTSSVYAQTPEPVAANPAPALTKHKCTKPEIPDGSKPIEKARMETLIAETNAYRDCVAAFAKEQKSSADAQQQIVQAAIASANAAIKEYNDFIEASNRETAPKKGRQP